MRALKESFVQGLRDGIPICLGYFSVSIAFGMSSVIMGIPIFYTFLISITNLTSAGQMAGAGLLASKAALIEIALTTLIINARYFLMSLSLSQKVNPKMKLWQRMLVSYGITDEIFAVEIGQSGLLSFSYMSGLIVCSAFGWFTGTLIGASAGSLLPAGIGAALNISLYAMFIAIVTPASLASKPVLFCSISSAVLSILFSILPGFKEISAGYMIILITLIISVICALRFPVHGEDHQNLDENKEGKCS